MLRIVLCFLIYLLSVSSYAQYGQVKKGLKLLEKGAFTKAQLSTKKAFEKDSLYSGAFYLSSKLLFQRAFNYNIDSAYLLVNSAIQRFDSLEEKEAERLITINLGKSDMLLFRSSIDSAAFDRAVKSNSEEAFIYFLKKFIYGEKFKEPAIKKRDSLAFESAKRVNTYQAYKSFLEKYPKSMQSDEATRLYEKLFFIKSTSDGRLSSYSRFLRLHPETAYRREAEQNIFEIMTAGNTPDSYQKFINEYEQSIFSKKAKSLLYHNLKETGMPFPESLKTDSIRQVIQLESGPWFVVMKNKKYGFMDDRGQTTIPLKYDKTNSTYLCQGSYDNYLELGGKIVARNGKIISNDPYDEVTDLGFGWLGLEKDKRQGLVHKSGTELLPTIYDEIKLLDNCFIAASRNGKWQVFTFTGRRVLELDCEDIFSEGKFVIFEYDGQYDFKSHQQLAAAVDQQPLSLQFIFNDYELVTDDQIWLKSDYGEAIFTSDQMELIPYKKQEIRLLKNGFAVEADQGVMIYNEKFEPILKQPAQSVKTSLTWIAAEYGNGWTLIKSGSNKPILKDIESLVLKGEYFALIENDDSTWVYVNDEKHLFDQNLNDMSILASSESEYLIIQREKKQMIVDQQGQMLEVGNSIEISPAGEGFIFTQKGKMGVIHMDGEIVVKNKYDVIGNLKNLGFSLLKDQKFGLYTLDGNLIETKYDAALRAFDSRLLIARQKGSAGIINYDNEEVVPFDYEDIVYWNDTSCFVKKNYQWIAYDIPSQSETDLAIRSFQYVRHDSVEHIAIFRTEEGYGVMSNKRGEIISPTFNDIINIGTETEPLYFTEKHIEEAGFYIVIYYSSIGQPIRKEVYEGEDYDLIYCDD